MKSKKAKLALFIGLVTAVITALLVWYLKTHSIPVFETGGVLADKEKSLMLFGLILAAIVVIPTFFLTIMIAIKYNEKNVTERTKYRPDFDHSRLFESIWWGVPIIIIGILSYVAWTSAHNLSPYKALASDKQPLEVDVVSLNWKWLFIYPDQGIASVNLAEIPVNTPVDFKLTSDTIMNSFWVPALGGQIYTMPGMITQIQEEATKTGDFAGSPANVAGKGFARMDFTIRSASADNFDSWVARARQADRPLTSATYAELAKPSMGLPVSYYSSIPPTGFFRDIAMKYMMPDASGSGSGAKAKSTAGGSSSSDQATSGMPMEMDQ